MHVYIYMVTPFSTFDGFASVSRGVVEGSGTYYYYYYHYYTHSLYENTMLYRILVRYVMPQHHSHMYVCVYVYM